MRLLNLSDEFRQLAQLFDHLSTRAAKAAHLQLNLEENAARAGRLLWQAAEAGVFADDRWWTLGKQILTKNVWKSPRAQVTFDGHTYEGRCSFKVPRFTRLNEDAERFARLWVSAIGSWLVKRWPEAFRENAATREWFVAAKDNEGRLIGKNGRVIRMLHFCNGEPIPDDFETRISHLTFWNAIVPERLAS